MIRFKSFILEMAAPLDHHREMTFYHGTNEESAKKILETGHIKGRDTQGKGQLAPVKGKAYMTKDIGYAQIYAIGGDMAGSNWWSSHAKGDHGYVFEVKGHHLKDIQPDEDQVGEMTVRPSWGDITKHDNNGVHPHLKDMAKRLATSTQYRKAADGEYAPQSAIGKKMLKHMSDSDKLHMIDKGCHVAADGPVTVSRAWRIHKSKVQHLKRDGSNFFDHAEEIPIHKPNLSESHSEEFIEKVKGLHVKFGYGPSEMADYLTRRGTPISKGTLDGIFHRHIPANERGMPRPNSKQRKYLRTGTPIPSITEKK